MNTFLSDDTLRISSKMGPMNFMMGHHSSKHLAKSADDSETETTYKAAAAWNYVTQNGREIVQDQCRYVLYFDIHGADSVVGLSLNSVNC